MDADQAKTTVNILFLLFATVIAGCIMAIIAAVSIAATVDTVSWVLDQSCLG